MRKIDFEGRIVEVPDDFSPEDINATLDELPKHAPTWMGITQAIPGVASGIARQAAGGMMQAIGEGQYTLPGPSPWSTFLINALAARGKKAPELAEAGKIVAEQGKEVAKEEDPGATGFWKRAYLSGGSSVLSQVPGLALSIMSGSPLPSIMSAMALTGGQTYSESREAGETPEKAKGRAAIDMSAEAVFEYLPTKFLVDNVGGPILRTITGTLVREVPTEMLTTVVQSANARLRDKEQKDIPWSWEDYAQDILDTAGATMISSPLLAMGASAIHQAGATRGEPGVGTAPPPSGEPTPALEAPAPQQGAVNLPLTSPSYDQPTQVPDSATKAQLDALIQSIDAELITDQQVEEAKKTIAVLDEARQKPVLQNAQVLWHGVTTAPMDSEDIGEFGASSKQTANAPNYINPNTGDRLNFPVLYGPENDIGLKLGQVAPQHTTYVIGEPTDDRPADMLKAMHETVEQWRKKYMPNSTIVISNEQLASDAALGWSYSSSDQHVIVPAVLRKATRGLGAFNVNTQAGIFFNLTHEFGHALVMDRFMGTLPQEVVTALRADSRAGLISPETISKLSPEQAAVVQEYNAIKGKILSDSMTAQEFVDTWFSPAKLGRETLLSDLNVAPSDNAKAVVRAIINRAVSKSRTEDKKSALRRKYTNDFLSLEEYLAEQTARFAYQRQWDQKSPLGNFFQKALQSLRNFFASLKKDHIIAPGTSFAEWLDGLSRADRPLNEGKRLAEGKKKAKAAPKAKAKEKSKTTKKTPAKKVVKVQHNAETDTLQVTKDKLMRLLTDLELSEVISEDVARELYDLVERNEFDAFIDKAQPYMAKNVKFQLDDDDTGPGPELLRTTLNVVRAGLSEAEMRAPARVADALNEWREKQFRSKYFKVWFGDWESHPQQASKVRVGLFHQGMLQQDPGRIDQKFVTGLPLIVYHSTRANFMSFDRGDIGFHFGTVRAAHARMGDIGSVSSDLPGGEGIPYNALIIPAVLNLRNPLYVGREDGGADALWHQPVAAMRWLLLNGWLTPEAYQNNFWKVERLWYEFGMGTGGRMNLYQAFTPVRQALLDSGHDGIVYDNTVEGDVSFVAFHPNQVKSILGSRTFSRSDNMHWELDFDAATTEGAGGGRFLKSIKNFVNDPGPLRRALRKIQHSAFYLLELQQLAHLNPDVTGLTMMSEDNTRYNAQKSRLQAPADAVSHEWSDLGKEWDSKISKFLFAEREGQKLWFDLTKEGGTYKYAMNAETVARLKEYGIELGTPEGDHAAKIILDGKNALLYQLNEMERALIIALQNRYAGAGAAAVTAAVIPLRKQVHSLRKQPFFPQGRFGNMLLTVSRKKAQGPGYEVTARYAFEERASWEKATKEAEAKKSPDELIRAHELTDNEYVLMALPTDFVELAASELGLNDQQVEQLMQILQPIKPEKAFSKYDEARLGLKGYSTDAIRSFANFTWHNANLIAKLEYRSRFNLAIRDVGSNLRAAEYAAQKDLPLIERLGRIEKYMKRTRDYIMAPPYEAQSIRAIVSIAYLGLNVKTALVNFYGMVTTWDDLTQRHGVAEGTTRFLRAMKRGLQSLELTDLNQKRSGDYLPPEIQTALDRALEEGVLSQSYAYHLAGLANAGNLDRLFGPSQRQTARRWSQRIVDGAMFPFRLTELATRRISFLAEFESAMQDPNLGMTDPYTEAVSRTNKLQNDYSMGNRAPFLRGIKTQSGHPLAKVLEPALPLATIFMTFTQHMAFHAYGGYELGERRMSKHLVQPPKGFAGSYTAKIWLLTLLLAGYEGLPGAENLLDLVEAAWRKFGGRKPMRQELRELIQSVTDDPELWARGLGHNVLGFDLSRSIGLGRMFPGTDVLAHPKDDVSSSVGTLALDLAGPAGGFVKWGLDLFISNKPPSETFARLPGGLGNIWTAYKWSQDGVRAPSGALITHDLQTGKLRDLTATEIFGKALGFNPTIVSQNREIMFAQYDRKIYWQTRRDILLDDYWRAHWQKDREAQADVRKAVTKFNESIPDEYRTLRVTGADIARSVQSRQRIKRFEERQSTPQRRYRPLYKDVKESFGQP